MKAADCILGIDAGSSVVKAVAFDCAGLEICTHEIPAELSRPHPLWVEQEMNRMWEMVKTCTVKVSQALRKKKRKIGGIGITSTGDGTWMMDGRGNSVRPGILWCDGRAGEIVARWHRQGLAQEAFAICGTSVFTGSQAAQLAWLREHEPAALKKAAVIFHAKDWLFHQFTGEITSDDTDESLTMLRMSTRQYDRELFRIFKIDDLYDKFPPVRPCGENVSTIRSAIAEELGLPAGLLVGSGPMDVAACALGTGAIERGQASSILGTAGIYQLIMDKPILKPKMVGMTLCHGVRDRWIRLMAAMTATPNLDWFLREIGQGLTRKPLPKGRDFYLNLEKLVESVPAGADGVVFHPYLFPGGERAPFVKPSARAAFTGLSLNHSVNHLLRAVYEGVALSTLDCYQHMPFEPEMVYLSGGGAGSAMWCQILADCLGKDVAVPEGSQFGAKGAAINAALALGVYRDPQEAVRQSVKTARLYRPCAKNTRLYRELYRVYKKTYESQMDVWDLRERVLN